MSDKVTPPRVGIQLTIGARVEREWESALIETASFGSDHASITDQLSQRADYVILGARSRGSIGSVKAHVNL